MLSTPSSSSSSSHKSHPSSTPHRSHIYVTPATVTSPLYSPYRNFHASTTSPSAAPSSATSSPSSSRSPLAFRLFSFVFLLSFFIYIYFSFISFDSLDVSGNQQGDGGKAPSLFTQFRIMGGGGGKGKESDGDSDNDNGNRRVKRKKNNENINENDPNENESEENNNNENDNHNHISSRKQQKESEHSDDIPLSFSSLLSLTPSSSPRPSPSAPILSHYFYSLSHDDAEGLSKSIEKMRQILTTDENDMRITNNTPNKSKKKISLSAKDKESYSLYILMGEKFLLLLKENQQTHQNNKDNDKMKKDNEDKARREEQEKKDKEESEKKRKAKESSSPPSDVLIFSIVDAVDGSGIAKKLLEMKKYSEDNPGKEMEMEKETGEKSESYHDITSSIHSQSTSPSSLEGIHLPDLPSLSLSTNTLRTIDEDFYNTKENSPSFLFVGNTTSAAAQELTSLLPSLPAAALPFPIKGENASTAQRRFDLISSLHPHNLPSSFPIVMIAYNRPIALREALSSLLRVRGVILSQITVYQDGNDESVKAVATEMGVRIVQNQINVPFKNVMEDGAAKIARHYRYTLSHAFDSNPAAENVIIVEDDMVFSPDFLLYFIQLSPLYRIDPTIYCITSWNDNGFKGHSHDPRMIHRTDFFVGLGWMVSRNIYKNEMESIWPATHWDHWMREDQQRKGRQTVYPEVSRNYNIGKRGTHSDDSLFIRYFQFIIVNQQESVYLGNIQRITRTAYHNAYWKQFHQATTIPSVPQLLSSSHSPDSPSSSPSASLTLRLSYAADSTSTMKNNWETHLSAFFRLWHSWPIRGEFERTMRIKWKGNVIFIVPQAVINGIPKSPVAEIGNNSPLTVIPLDQFRLTSFSPSMVLVAAKPKEDCISACSSLPSKSFVCDALSLHLANTCDVMRKVFPCEGGCSENEGEDQPAYVSKGTNELFRQCLVNKKQSSCVGKHAATQRLCPCSKLVE